MWLAGACAAVAVVVFGAAVAAAFGVLPGLSRRRTRPAGVLGAVTPAQRQSYRVLAWAAAGVGLVVWVVSGWPVYGLLAAAVVAGAPLVANPGGSAVRRIEMLEALGEWLRHLASMHVAGLAVEQTIRASGHSAPEALSGQVRLLVSRMEAGWPAVDAYRAFADDLADGVVDNVVMMLMTHTDQRGAGMATALRELADSLEYEATGAREVEAERARTRTSTRAISLIALAMTGMTLFAFEYAEPFGTVQGQVFLALTGGLFVSMLWWMYCIARVRAAQRLLDSSPSSAPSDDPSAGVVTR
jgi:Flp pilus assembly protein TadB